MKRSFFVLLAVCAVAALGGWGTARTRNSLLEHRATDATHQAEVEALAQARVPARQIAALVREADEVVIAYSYSGATDMAEADIRFNDPVWRSELADILEKSLFKATSHGFWVSRPEIRFYRNHEQILTLSALHTTLRGYDQHGGGDFIVGEKTIDAMRALVREKSPAKVAATASERGF